MNTTINLRISSELKNKLDESSEEKNMSISETTRLILETYFTNEPNFEREEGITCTTFDIKPPLWQSLEFLQLMCWIFDQKSLPIQSYSYDQFEEFKHTIIEFRNNPNISNDLKMEFQKVLIDLIKTEDNFLLNNDQMNFAKKENKHRFNYKMLKQYLFDSDSGINEITVL